MNVRCFASAHLMSAAAAQHAAGRLRQVIERQGQVRLVAATAASQLEFQKLLATAPGISWSRVELFQLDEYVGLPKDHPASFRRLLFEHFIEKTGLTSYHLLDGEHPSQTCADVGRKLAERLVDVAFLGIGENAHLAFNDPPADFATVDPYTVVGLDDACRRQQVGEGWFARLEDVPHTAVSMSIRQILKARELLVIVPDARKATAVKATLEGEMTPEVPASVLRTHQNVTMFVDEPAASQLSPATRARFEL